MFGAGKGAVREGEIAPDLLQATPDTALECCLLRLKPSPDAQILVSVWVSLDVQFRAKNRNGAVRRRTCSSQAVALGCSCILRVACVSRGRPPFATCTSSPRALAAGRRPQSVLCSKETSRGLSLGKGIPNSVGFSLCA